VFLIARRNTPTVLDPVEKAFDLISRRYKYGLKQYGSRRFRRGGVFAQLPREFTNVRISVAS
jgi:hypothetical protein